LAYLREEKEAFEIDYALDAVWNAIPKAVKTLQWNIEKKDDEKHTATIKTKAGFLAYSSTLTVEAKAIGENTTRMSISAETPVTTITAMADFGRAKDRIEFFVTALAVQMGKKQPEETVKRV
jgi:hypothetical protein